MLSPKTQYNLRQAKEYFEEHLAVGDYYSEQQVVAGEWFDEGARMLALSSVVKAGDFLALCDNLDPRTGEKLTVRHKTTRNVSHVDREDGTAANRRVFYDFTISPPKSVSIVALAGGDERIVHAHDETVRVAMRELEKFVATRVRKGMKIEDRFTVNMVAAVFRHDTSRALDPHLHSHCIVFNATFDVIENRWKALQNHDMLVARKYVENVYYHELARALRRFGYQIENAQRGDFIVVGVSEQLSKIFAKRHTEIDEHTRALLLEEPEMGTRNIAAVREHIAHDRRSRKTAHIDMKVLREEWRRQMGLDGQETLRHLKSVIATRDQIPSTMDEYAALRWAEEHLFDRRSLVREHELWRYALERGRGENFTIEQLHIATAQVPYLRDRNKPDRLTTRPVLQREWEIICMARDGVNARTSLLPNWNGNTALDEAQQVAASQILGSRDFVTLFRGGAGTGKSFTLKVVFDALKQQNQLVQVLAPQRHQTKNLMLDGMTGAQTSSEFLARQKMVTGTVVIVDEAGQIGAKDMLDLMTFVQSHRGRLILSGDTRQHGAVQASDALWAIEKYGRLKVAELNEIRRQDPARGRDEKERQWISEHRKAVKEASEGKIALSFDRLDDAGAIVKCSLANQQDKLAQHSLELAKAGQTALIVSPTWGEIHQVNTQVRAALQTEGLVGREEWKVTALQADDLTDAQKRDTRYYTEDSVIVFNQTAQGIPKGASGKLITITDDSLIVEAGGRIRSIPARLVSRLTVCKAYEMALCKGDRIQLKANAKIADGRRVANGELATVKHVGFDGNLHLEDGRILPPEYRQFVRGYAVTSYASQGKTVDQVLFSDSCIKAATNDQQWYVTISRGRRGVKIFTTDKEQLRESVVRPGRRELAMDIVTAEPTPEPHSTPFYGYKTLKAWIFEVSRRARALSQIRARADHRQQISRPSSP